MVSRDVQDPVGSREVRIQREASLMRLLDHPNIAELKDFISTPDFFYLVFEYVTGGQVLDYIIAHGRLREKVARKFFRQLVSAVGKHYSLSVI